MQNYKRLNKIEFLFYGLAVGYYFGSLPGGKSAMIGSFLIAVLIAFIGFVMDRREIARANKE